MLLWGHKVRKGTRSEWWTSHQSVGHWHAARFLFPTSKSQCYYINHDGKGHLTWTKWCFLTQTKIFPWPSRFLLSVGKYWVLIQYLKYPEKILSGENTQYSVFLSLYLLLPLFMPFQRAGHTFLLIFPPFAPKTIFRQIRAHIALFAAVQYYIFSRPPVPCSHPLCTTG